MPRLTSAAAYAYGMKGDFDKAIADYTEADSAQPEIRRRLLAIAAGPTARRANYDKAIADYNEAIRLNQKTPRRIMLAERRI